MAIDGKFLLEMGMDMMSQPYGPTPTNAFTGMSEAYKNAIGLQQIRTQQQQEAEDRAREQAERQAAAAKIQQQKAAFGQFVKGMPNADALLALYDTAPDQAVQAAQAQKFAPPAEPALGAGDLGDYEQAALASLFGEKSSYTPQEYEQARNLGQQMRLSANQARATPPVAPVETVAAEMIGDDYRQIGESAKGAREKLSSINIMRQLNESIESGSAIAPLMTKLQGSIKDLTGYDIDPNDPAAAKEAYEAMAVELMRQERQHGPRDARFTDKDAEFYMQSVSSMANTPEGRKLIVEIIGQREEARVKREQYLQDRRRKYLNDGDSSGIALEKAVNDTLMRDHDLAMNRKGMFVDEETGQLTELGQRFQAATGVSPAASAQPVRTGTKDGNPVRQMQDGTVEIFRNGKWEKM